MKKLLLILVFGITGTIGSFGQTLDEFWEFTNLYAADDTSGITHLYYAQQKTRIHNCYNGYNYNIVQNRSTIHRYHNPSMHVDSVFIPMHDYVTMPGCSGGGGVSIADFHPFDGNPENGLFSGGFSDGFEPYAYLQVGNISFYLSPLFFQFQRVEANPNLGDFIFLPFQDVTVRVPLTDNQDTIRVLNDHWYNWRDYNWSGYNPIDSLDGYFTGYDFNLISLSRFDDSLAFYQKDGTIHRSENLGRTGDTLNISLSKNSEFYFDADSLHIYVTRKGSNSILVSEDYGNQGSWSTIELPSFNNFFAVDPKIPGLVYYADSSRIYRSEDFATSFEEIHAFENNIRGLYKKPSSDILYVLFKDKLIELNENETTILKEAPKKKTLNIDITEIPYKTGNEFIYRVYKYEQRSEDSYALVPVEDYKMKVTEVLASSDASIKRQIMFENNSAHPLLSELIFDDDNNILAAPWRGKQHQVILKNERLPFEPWVISSQSDSLLELGIIRGLGRGYALDNYDTTATVDFYLDENADSTAKMGKSLARLYWSNNFGVKDVYFWTDSSRYRYNLKGAVLDGIVYGDTAQTFTVSNEANPSEIPQQVSLKQNYPNPFNPATVISYQLNSNQRVRLEVFDVTGRKVAVLVDGERKPVGTHQVYFDGSGLSSGVYFYRLQTDGQTLTKKMLLMK